MQASAQVKFGAIAGLNIANLSQDPDDRDFSSRVGFGIGGVLDYGLGESIVLRVEPMILGKGAKESDRGTDVTVKLIFLEIPMMVKYAFGTNDVQPYVMAGPTLGLNMSAKAEGSDDGFEIDEDLKDDIKSVDFGFGIGAGVSRPIGDHSAFAELRYSAGLTNLNDQSSASDASLKTNGVQFFIGIIFGKAKK